MDALPTVFLKPGEADRVVAGHPWVYHGEILRLTQEPADGELVQIKDHRQRFLGVGFFNSKSKINVRVLSPERVEINERFFEERIRAALAVRQKHLPGTTSFRVVNAESDFLSGLIVDKYGWGEATDEPALARQGEAVTAREDARPTENGKDVLVVQISSFGMDKRKAHVVAALQQIFSPRAILERSDMASRKFEGLAEAGGVLAGEPIETVWTNLNGLEFETDLAAGHKTGLYLDQQVNYQRVAAFLQPANTLNNQHVSGQKGNLFAKGAQVLDCFSFLGGFGLHAARAGAAHVHLLDQSAEAMAAAQRNAAANGLADKCSFETVNVFDWLKAQTAVQPHEKVIPRFDLIILDPPSFTRNRASVPDALRGYKEIHIRALKLLKAGGTLATFCCSHHVDATTFLDVILSAAYDTRRILRRVAIYSQSPDHPVIPMIPETEYLKGFAFELVR
ncbi:MAG TPA: class I SAM-dependent rRNA methyltransferase [Candidatus Sulfopaludibacter sp.]|nr:class I SAM-dependent rRNA methyltransferase [Candidatus Sulfopaludibacter sp.]